MVPIAAQPAVAVGPARRSLRSLSRWPLNGAIVGQLAMNLSLFGLVGLRAWGVAHAAASPTLQFGEPRPSTSPSDRERTTGEYALHIQCSWAIAVGGSRYESVQDPPSADDALRSTIARQLRVTCVDEGPSGRLQISLEEDAVLELDPAACGTDEEAWRLLRPGTDAPHLVRYGSSTCQE
jgi:hypothetical protein